ncbi:fungal-specific transcription factor domain-containing protein [Aspergillus navahoensis]
MPGDMRRPMCGLCYRTGQNCEFPTRRRRLNQNKERAVGMGGTAPKRQRNDNGRESSESLDPRLRQRVLSEPSLSPNNNREQHSILYTDTQPTPNDPSNPNIYPLCTPSVGSGIPSGLFPSGVDSLEGLSLPQRRAICLADHANESVIRAPLPATLCSTLLDTYFTKVQTWLPLLHRPTFYQNCMVPGTNELRSLSDMSLEECFIIHGIFALAARHCSISDWEHISPAKRGSQFMAKAQLAYNYLRITGSGTSIPLLQGCILLACCGYTSDMAHHGLFFTGACVTLAYDLNLHHIDADPVDEDQTPDTWVRKEGLRRIWWLVWELDRFGSILSERPFSIDSRSIKVLLPVSDTQWFDGVPLKSVMLDPKPHNQTWKDLKDSPNQSERAWFLTCNHLLSLVYEWQNQGADEYSHLQMETILNCFRLALPQSFNLYENPPVTDGDQLPQCNWIISTNLLLVSALMKCDMATSASSAIISKRLQSRISDLLRMINSWPLEAIPLCHPFIACTLLGPNGGWVDSTRKDSTFSIHDQAGEIIKLILSHFARYWGLGTTLLTIERSISSGKVGKLSRSYTQRFRALLPNHMRVSMTCKHLVHTEKISKPEVRRQRQSTNCESRCGNSHNEVNKMSWDLSGQHKLHVPESASILHMPDSGAERISDTNNTEWSDALNLSTSHSEMTLSTSDIDNIVFDIALQDRDSLYHWDGSGCGGLFLE